MHKDGKPNAGCGTVGRTAIAGIWDHGTNDVCARTDRKTDTKALRGHTGEHIEPDPIVHMDGAAVCQGLTKHGYGRKAVDHGVGEYVSGIAHTNGIENFWIVPKRTHAGTFHNQPEAP